MNKETKPNQTIIYLIFLHVVFLDPDILIVAVLPLPEGVGKVGGGDLLDGTFPFSSDRFVPDRASSLLILDTGEAVRDRCSISLSELVP